MDKIVCNILSYLELIHITQNHTFPEVKHSEDDEDENTMFSLSRLTNTTVFFFFDHPLSGIRGSDDGEDVNEDSIAVSSRE